jgi:hypothetical protein
MARVDQESIKLAAEEQVNLLPYVVGKAIQRPGTKHLGSARITPAQGSVKLIPFARNADTTALLELCLRPSSPSVSMRVYDSTDTLVSIPAVSCTIADSTLTGSGWTNASTGGATVTYAAPPGCLMYSSYTGGKAVIWQKVTTASVGTSHSLSITNANSANPVSLRIGTSLNGQDLVKLTSLPPGNHIVSFTPAAADFWVQFETSGGAVHVAECSIASAGPLVVWVPNPTSWATANLADLRYTQSLDEIFIAAADSQQLIIQHRGPTSWSLCYYFTNDGPFQDTQSDPNIFISPSSTQGTPLLTSNYDFFTSDKVGQLLQISHSKTNADYFIAAQGASTAPIRVTGIQVAGDREWSATISGTWVGTISVERSFNNQFSGYEVYKPMVASGDTYVAGSPVTTTVNATISVNDASDNAIAWYRLTFSSYTSGAATVHINYGGFGGTGICRIIEAVTPTTAYAEVFTPFTDVTPSKVWLEGDWSDARGWPTACAFFDGRLWWARDNQFWGSVADSFFSMAVAESASTTTSGTTMTTDASSIQRYIATGGTFDDVQYMLPLQRLLMGTSGAEIPARSSNLDEPLTPTNVTLRDSSSQGSANIQAVKIDKRGIMVQGSTHKLYALAYNPYNQDFDAENILRINEDIGYPDNPAYTTGFVDLAVQRQPETYIWAARSDGIAVCVLYEPAEKVQALFRIMTGTGEFSYDGAGQTPDEILQVVVIPQTGEDSVYWLVKRYISGVACYYIEKMEAHRDTLTRVWDSTTRKQVTAPGTRQVDSYVYATPDATNTVSGLSHLAGRTVMALGYSDERATYGPLLNSVGGTTFTVSGAGTITLGETASTGVRVGIPYYGYYKSSKLVSATAQGDTTLLKPKKVGAIGLLMQDTHPDALLLGSDFDGIETMDPLPRIEDLKPVQTKGALQRLYDKRLFPFANVWDTDARVCIQVQPGYSTTLSHIVLELET